VHELEDKIGIPSDRMLRVSIGLCTTIIVIAALYFAYSVFAPLAFALLIIAIVWPLQKRLQTWLPKILALAATILMTAVIVTEFVSLVAWSFGRVGSYVIGDASRFQLIYGRLAEWLEGHGIAVAGIWGEHFNVGWLIRLSKDLTLRMNSALSFSIVMLTYVILGLLEVDVVADKLRALKTGELGRILLVGGASTGAKWRRYMLVRSLMSVATGLLVWGFAAAVGLELAVEWGVIAFALNYIPFIGPLVATVLPTLIAIAQYGTWEMTMMVFACLNFIQFAVGSYLEPLITGHTISISPFLVLFAVFFWTFVWGIAGAFIGVPIVIAALTLCEQHPSSRWIADLLAGSGERKA
jgi:predicted PurR-regulated permease PerM